MKVKTKVKAGGGSQKKPESTIAPASDLPDWVMRGSGAFGGD